jgi:spermidine/putrescine transport system permease protein
MKKKMNLIGLVPSFWFSIFLFFPILITLLMSFQKRGTYGGVDWVFNFDNYIRAFDLIYLKIFWKSLVLSGVTTMMCLILAYPLSWALVTLPQRKRAFFLLLLIIPFLTNMLIRIYALKIITAFDGPFIWVLSFLGLQVDPFKVSQNIYLVMYGMVTTYLPYMIFPLYAAMDRMNFSLIEAAEDLGASQFGILNDVLIPCTKSAALTGASLVFIPCLGEYLIPDLLGGAKSMLMGNLITEQFLKARDWPFGAALAMILIFILVVFIFLTRKKDSHGEA